ncbi:CsbD family protein [Methylobacterium sp. J-088]|uniref:CsbD family protein n=1 Tax=Methylobacterium sp. J-088 TaxID=2836664 RepID=UPI001FB9607B|nr:CsbD family protein [Methylobacterium sp. J-088]MCJ2062763.1 CsbD family protein [Methylobacterium sp. J-088]
MDENRITGATKEFGGKVQGAVGEVTGDRETQARGKANEAKGSAENLVGQGKDAIREVADQAGNLVDRVIDRGRDASPQAGSAYRQGSETVARYAKDSPLALAAMAGAVGYLLAMVIHGRR